MYISISVQLEMIIDSITMPVGHLSLAFIESCNYLSESCKDFVAGLLVPKVALTLYIASSFFSGLSL